MENIVYACDSDAGKVYLRLTTPLRRARPEIEAEVNWIEHLSKCGLPVPRVIPNLKGDKIGSFSEGDSHYEAVVFAGMAGAHPSKDIATDPTFLKTLGILIAKMHQASERYEGIHLKREGWFEERGLRHALSAAASAKQSPLKQRFEETIAWMRQLPRTPKTYGLIHADLGALNLFLQEDGSISIIDFDDSCYHWFIFDLTLVICSMAIRFEHAAQQTVESTWLKYLIEGYRTIRPLSQDEIDWVPKFEEFIFLRLYFWIEHHQSLDTFHDAEVDRITRLKQQIMNRLLREY